MKAWNPRRAYALGRVTHGDEQLAISRTGAAYSVDGNGTLRKVGIALPIGDGKMALHRTRHAVTGKADKKLAKRIRQAARIDAQRIAAAKVKKFGVEVDASGRTPAGLIVPGAEPRG
jgi:hypothetical protein